MEAAVKGLIQYFLAVYDLNVPTYFLCIPACPQDEAPGSGLKDQQVLSVWGHCQMFQHSVETLSSQLQEKGEAAELVWDKVMQTKWSAVKIWEECGGKYACIDDQRSMTFLKKEKKFWICWPF